MLTIHLKKLTRHPLTLLVYFIISAYITLSASGFFNTAISSAQLDLAVIDYDQSADSRAYLDALSKRPLIHTMAIDLSSAQRQLQREAIDAILIIPQDSLSQLGDRKLSLTYNSSDAMAPALIDILALDLLPQVVKSKVNDAAKRYLSLDDLPDLSAKFSNIYQSMDAHIVIDLRVASAQAGTYSEAALSAIETLSTQLLFSLFLIILMIVYPLSHTLSTSENIIESIATSPLSLWQFWLSERLVALGYSILPWLLSVFVGRSLVAITWFNSLLIALAGLAVIIFYYEIFCLIERRLSSIYGAVLTFSIVLVPAILGGVFFDSALLAERVWAIAARMPFGALNALLSAIFEGSSPSAAIRSLSLYSLGAVLLFSLQNHPRRAHYTGDTRAKGA